MDRSERDSILGPAEEDAVSALAALVGGSEALELIMVVAASKWMVACSRAVGTKSSRPKKVSRGVSKSARENSKDCKISWKIHQCNCTDTQHTTTQQYW